METKNLLNSNLNSMKKFSSAILLDGSGWGRLVEDHIFQLEG